MVTCTMDSKVVQKMSRPRKSSASNSSGFRLLDGDSRSSVSRNSIYKIKIDAMFDDTRSLRSHNRFDDRNGSHRTRSIIMYGKSDLKNNNNNNGSHGDNCSTTSSHYMKPHATLTSLTTATNLIESAIDSYNANNNADRKESNSRSKLDNRRINNSVQAQIERMFTDVVKDATCSFDVKCLGSLPLKEKVTSLSGLQEPLRQLYLCDSAQKNQRNGYLDICASGLRVRKSINEQNELSKITPFHNIAVWSAVKFVVSQEEGGAAFLPLITDPENIDKSSLFRPLTAADQRRLTSNIHAPIFAVVMRSSGIPKLLECHAFVCQSPEDAIVIAATLYQSLMAHVSNSNSSRRSAKKRSPRNQNGVSCISIASSSALTGSNYMTNAAVARKNSPRNSDSNSPTSPQRSSRKKRAANSSLSAESENVQEIQNETTTDERKKKSYKSKRAPAIPVPARNVNNIKNDSVIEDFDSAYSTGKVLGANNKSVESLYHTRAGGSNGAGGLSEVGDILTRVAIPRSGSFLNTGGLTRYKSRATRRVFDKNDTSGELVGGGGGSPLGFSELFNEFRLHENLHSLDDILSAIINADGMSFNNLKPIYKEFLLKLAVTLTKDELYQRSKNIMRRQRKKKLKSKNSAFQKKRNFFFGSRLRNVFRFGKFRSKSFKTNQAKKKQNGLNDNQTIKTNDKNKMTNSRATSGSDVSRHENTLIGLNRNSSSGYVSCSECSYDSEACTCASADRCYCSLGAEHQNHRILDKYQPKKIHSHERRSNTPGHRDSLLSCRTEDKCYCSLGDTPQDDTSDTTFCDTDSCVSASKCYCKRSQLKHERKIRETTSAELCSTALQRNNNRNKKLDNKSNDKLGLDYDLFTVAGGGYKSRSRHNSNHHHNSNSSYIARSIRPQDAISMKKSVEAAAIFADVKLSQTTDIKNLRHDHNFFTPATTKKSKKRESKSSDRSGSTNKKENRRSSSGHRKTSSADDILSKLHSVEKVNNYRHRTYGVKNNINNESHYQSVRAVRTSLEDSLGYLP